MKKLINKVDDVIVEQLKGMAKAHRSLKVNIDPHFIVRADAPIKGEVSLISGGGSGHEPLHGGFVGYGMLTAACPGEVFTSPTPNQMIEAAYAADSGAGVLFLVKNYTGDVLNFEMAIEMLTSDGHKVQAILVDDDVSVKNSLYTTGRRGVGTTVIMEKIVGAATAAGYTLDQCADLARKVNLRGRSMGVALTSCTTPAAGKPTFDLAEDEIEIGVGIHGEPGQKRMPMTTADEITTILTNEILNDSGYTRIVREWDRDNQQWVEKELTDEPLESGDDVLLFVNGMGGTPVSELYTVYLKAAELIEARGLNIKRNLIGPFITSLDMAGASITIVKMDAEMLKFWDARVNTPALCWGM